MCDRHRQETQAASHGAVPPAAGLGTAIWGLGPNSLGAMGIGEGAAAKSDHRVPICATILGKSGPPPSRPSPEPTPDPDVPPVRSRDSRKGSKPPPPDGAVVIAQDSHHPATYLNRGYALKDCRECNDCAGPATTGSRPAIDGVPESPDHDPAENNRIAGQRVSAVCRRRSDTSTVRDAFTNDSCNVHP